MHQGLSLGRTWIYDVDLLDPRNIASTVDCAPFMSYWDNSCIKRKNAARIRRHVIGLFRRIRTTLQVENASRKKELQLFCFS